MLNGLQFYFLQGKALAAPLFLLQTWACIDFNKPICSFRNPGKNFVVSLFTLIS